METGLVAVVVVVPTTEGAKRSRVSLVFSGTPVSVLAPALEAVVAVVNVEGGGGRPTEEKENGDGTEEEEEGKMGPEVVFDTV